MLTLPQSRKNLSATLVSKTAAMAQILFLLCCFLGGLLPGIVYAQPSQQAADVTLDAAARAAVIDGAVKALNESYVFPAVAKQMEESIRARQTRGEYDSITNGREFAQVLTDHLRAVSRDKHLSVNYTSAVMPPEPPSNPPAVRPSPDDQSRLERQNALAARQNYGFTR